MLTERRTRLFLHLANGTATTDLIERAAIPGNTSIWADPLHDGPVPGALDESGLRAVRARYISEMATDVSYDDVHAALVSWEAAIPQSAACDELVLWFEHDLFDQLNLVHLLDRIQSSPAKAPIVSLVCIGAFPGRPDFKGLGELTPDDIASLLGTRQEVSAAQYALARRAWHAFRSATPEAVERLLGEDLDALPFLAAAFRRHLEEFPSTRDGLSRTERRVLEIGSSSPIDVGRAFSQLHDGETAFFIADASFLDVVRHLAALTPALLTFDGHVIQTTADGMAVLNKAADRVALCGIDRWLGGVHLEGRGPVWRWDAASGRIGHG